VIHVGQTACFGSCSPSRSSLRSAEYQKIVLAPEQLPGQHHPLRSSWDRLWRMWSLYRRLVRWRKYFAHFLRCLPLAQALDLRNEKSVRRFVVDRYLEEVSRVSGSYGWILDLPRRSLINSSLRCETDSRSIASILGDGIEMFATDMSVLGRCSGRGCFRVGCRHYSSNVGSGNCSTRERRSLLQIQGLDGLKQPKGWP
jgi:hypothetical protein